MSALLEVKGLVKKFPGRRGNEQAVLALDGVNLVLEPSRHLALVGESGCGKTTLARIISGIERSDSGAVLFEGLPLRYDGASGRMFRRKIRMVFQDPFSSLDPRFTVRDILAEALCLEAPAAPALLRERMRQVLGSVGLAGDILGRYPRAFSGGERQRIAIARALMTDPCLLILDEPVSALDMLVHKQILDLFLELARTRPVTYLFITHSMSAARKISQRIAVMSQGRIVEYGPTKQVMGQPEHPYTRALLAAALDYRVREEAVFLNGKDEL